MEGDARAGKHASRQVHRRQEPAAFGMTVRPQLGLARAGANHIQCESGGAAPGCQGGVS